MKVKTCKFPDLIEGGIKSYYIFLDNNTKKI